MQRQVLHIVSFDNPFPPNYGGVIEVFYKIKALHAIGFELHLHCFVNSVPLEHKELSSITASVTFYKNKFNPFYFFYRKPFSVMVRSHKALLENLQKIEAPIWFEGLKTIYFSGDKSLKEHPKFLRLHNIEQDYFGGISDSETNWIKKKLFRLESKKYKDFEKNLSPFRKVVTLSRFETEYVHQKYENAVYVPVFHGNTVIENLDGFGKHVLYHGDLNTADNRKAAVYLIDIFKELPQYQLIIASGSQKDFIRKEIGKAPNIAFRQLNDFAMLQYLLQEAHLNIILSFQRSGTKLKLINALFHSRFCIINENIMDDTVVTDFCVKTTSKKELLISIPKLMQTPYADSARRKQILETYLDDIQNAQKIEEIINAV